MHNETRIFLITLLLISTCVQVGCSVSLCECPPGKYLSEPCTQENQHPACLDCPEGRFSDTTSSAMSCQDCQIDCQQREIVIQNCTKYYNLKCQCIPGTYRPPEAHGVCLNHKSCPPGFGVKYAGNEFHDTVCEKCISGTFSPDESVSQTCQPCRACPYGYEEERECKTYGDTVCKLTECGTPSNPMNGKVITPAGNHHNDVAYYSCENGFNLVGPPSRTCIAKKWTLWQPECRITQDRTTTWETLGPMLVVICLAFICLLVFRQQRVNDFCRNKIIPLFPCPICKNTSSKNVGDTNTAAEASTSTTELNSLPAEASTSTTELNSLPAEASTSTTELNSLINKNLKVSSTTKALNSRGTKSQSSSVTVEMPTDSGDAEVAAMLQPLPAAVVQYRQH